LANQHFAQLAPPLDDYRISSHRFDIVAGRSHDNILVSSRFIYEHQNYHEEFVLLIGSSVDAFGAVPARKHNFMASLPRPILPRSNSGLTDSRSTCAAPPGRVRDILALRGTIKTRS
jgi:hypothetical protein